MDRIMKAKIEAYAGKPTKAYTKALRQQLKMWLAELEG